MAGDKRQVEMAFVILHYNTLEDTKRCVESIREMNGSDNLAIVIVDNASPNGSGAEVHKMYQNDRDIKVILNKSNDGFSRGNNIGFRYIRKTYDAKFITICNSDIVFNDKTYIEDVRRIYEREGFCVLGPDIYNPKLKIHQSPLGEKSPSLSEVKRTIMLNKLAEITFPIFYPLIGKKEVAKAKKREDSVPDYDVDKDNVPLMGACFIFSDEFKRSKAFAPETFLYYEEFLLYNYCRRNDLRMIYRPEIKVTHNEGGATKSVSADEKNRYRRLVHNIRKAAEIYYKDLIRGNEK